MICILGIVICWFRGHKEVREPMIAPRYRIIRGSDIVSCSRCGMYLREVPSTEEPSELYYSIAEEKRMFQQFEKQMFGVKVEDDFIETDRDQHGRPLYTERYKERKHGNNQSKSDSR